MIKEDLRFEDAFKRLSHGDEEKRVDLFIVVMWSMGNRQKFRVGQGMDKLDWSCHQTIKTKCGKWLNLTNAITWEFKLMDV